MLYWFLRFLLQVSIKVFFKSIYISGKENIPDKGPLIIVANHPSTFMDPILIATILKRKIFFLAKGEVFKSRFAKWILPKFNMIPVYRKQDNPGEFHKNEETFDICYEHLENDGVILIFPEGTSITERRLRKIKTGAARIALGAEAKNNFNLGVKILQIGLNYSDPHSFKSEVFIKIDSPLDVKVYKELFENDPFNASNILTEQIKQGLESHIINIETQNEDDLVRNIEYIYKTKLAKDLGVSIKEKEEDFNLTKRITETVKYFGETDGRRVIEIDSMVKRYLNNLDRVGVSDDTLKPKQNNSIVKDNLLSALYLVIGFPLFLYGLINNYIPYRIPGIAASKFAPSREYYGPIAMITGLFSFIILYSIQISIVSDYFNPLFTFFYILSLPVSGYFAYAYWHTMERLRTRWLFISLFYKRHVLISNLIHQRKEVISEFDKAKNDYFNSK